MARGEVTALHGRGDFKDEYPIMPITPSDKSLFTVEIESAAAANLPGATKFEACSCESDCACNIGGKLGGILGGTIC